MHLNIKKTLYIVNCTPVELRCPSVMGLTLKTLSKQTCKQCSYQIITHACLVHRLDCCFLLAFKSNCFSKLASPNLFLLGLKISFGKTMYSVTLDGRLHLKKNDLFLSEPPDDWATRWLGLIRVIFYVNRLKLLLQHHAILQALNLILHPVHLECWQ